MGRYVATVRWQRGSDEFLKQRYSRGHVWQFDGGTAVPASASPQVVPAPNSVAAAVDPEEALVAALSSCHMLFALSFFSAQGFVVESYEDNAEGVMGTRPDGKTAMLRVVLRPVVTVSGNAPDEETAAHLHHRAHEECYIVNSVNFPVLVEPRLVRI